MLQFGQHSLMIGGKVFMNRELQNFNSGEIYAENYDNCDIGGQNYSVRLEIKKGNYSRIYVNGVLVGQSLPTMFASRLLLEDANSFAKFFNEKTSNVSILNITGDGFKLKYVMGDNIYSYLDGESVFYRNYQPTALGFLQAKFEAEQKARQLKEDSVPAK